jgi:hypothetical protein
MRRLMLLTGLLILAACGGGDDGESLEDRSQGYMDAIVSGDTDAAWAYWTKRCQDGQERAEFDSLVADVSSEYDSIERLEYSELINDAGDEAVINSTLNRTDLNDDSGTRWVNIDGEWYWDDC